MPITLNDVQKAHVRETVRPLIERIIKFRLELDAAVLELDNQQDAISNANDVLNDSPDSDAPRSDAPNLTGLNVQQLRNFANNMKGQVDDTAMSSLVTLAVRPVSLISRD